MKSKRLFRLSGLFGLVTLWAPMRPSAWSAAKILSRDGCVSLKNKSGCAARAASWIIAICSFRELPLSFPASASIRITSLRGFSIGGRPIFFRVAEGAVAGIGVTGGAGGDSVCLILGTVARFFLRVVMSGFATRIRTMEWPDDRNDDADQSISAVSSRSLGKRCAGISIGPSSGGAPPRKPHATSLPLMMSSRTWNCLSRRWDIRRESLSHAWYFFLSSQDAQPHHAKLSGSPSSQ